MSTSTSELPIASPFPPIREAWLASHQEEILDPDLPIIDPHHHLFDYPTWRYLLDDLLKDINTGHAIMATVFAECGAMYKASGPQELRPVGETEFVVGAAAMTESERYGTCHVGAGIVGHADLTIGSRVREVLQAHIQKGGGRFRGIRHISVWDPSPDVRCTMELPPPGLMSDRRFREGFAQLEPLGLSFDAWLYFTQMSELMNLVKAFPSTTVILDHIGGALGIGPYHGRRDEVFATWKHGIEALARFPNVIVKVGGMGMHISGFGFHERKMPPSSADLAAAWRPFVETCINSFGPERCMFESNFPVDKCSYSYPVMWNAFKRLCHGASGGEIGDLFAGTAKRVYRL